MRILLTGGGGFLGGAIAKRLVERGHSVRSFSRGRYPALEAIGVGHVQGDLGDRDAVIAAAKGCDAIVHTAAKAGVWGDPKEYRRANLDGTRNVLAACRRHQVPRLVYTSTPSVVHQAEGTAGGDEGGVVGPDEGSDAGGGGGEAGGEGGGGGGLLPKIEPIRPIVDYSCLAGPLALRSK